MYLVSLKYHKIYAETGSQKYTDFILKDAKTDRLHIIWDS